MRRSAPAVAVLAAVTWAVPARADVTQQCTSAAERGQQLRDDGKYLRARDAFTFCSRTVCPAMVQSDCIKWLADLAAATPSVVIIAKDASGNDVKAVTVTVDGVPLTGALDGRPIPVDPGEHQFHFETPGAPAVDERVVIHVGEKNRTLTAQFAGPPAASKQDQPPTQGPAAGAVAEPHEETKVGPHGGSSWHTIGWIAIGVGAASLVGSGVSLAVRQSALSDAQRLCGANFDGCPPNSSDVASDQSRGRTASTLFTVFGILGVAGVAGGIVLLATTDGHQQQSTITLRPTLAGAVATWIY